MPQNPYEDLLQSQAKGTPTPAANPYEAILQDMISAQQARMRVNQKEAAKTTPDAAAEADRLSKSTGLPTPTVQRNLDQVRQQQSHEGLPYEQIQTQSPWLAQWLGGGPDADPNAAHNAAVSHDDLPQLGNLEWLLSGVWSKGVAQGHAQIDVGNLRFQEALRGNLTQEERDRLNASKFYMGLGGDLGAGDSWFRNAVVGAAQQIPQFAQPLKYAAVGAIEMGALGAVAGSVLPGVGTVAGGLAGIRLGAQAGGLYGGAKSTFAIETGLALDEYQGMTDESGRPVDRDTLRAAAFAAGAINAGLEVGGLAVLAKPFLKLLPAGAAAKPAVRVAIRNALKVPTIRRALFEAVKTYGETLTAETAVEVAQRAVTIIAGQAALPALTGELSEADRQALAPLGLPATPVPTPGAPPSSRMTPGQFAGELGKEALGAAETFSLLGVPGAATTLATGVREARQASRSQTFFTALGEGMTASKTAQRAPEAVERLLQKAADSGPVPAVYAPVDTWTQYWQSRGQDPAAMAAEVTGDPGAYAHAEASETDLRIPTARYARLIAPTEHNAFFANELRLGPLEMNGREENAFVAEQEALAQQAGTETAAPTALDQIRETLAAELVKGGLFDERTAQHYATLVEQGVGRLAQDFGADPYEVYSRYGLRIRRSVAGETLTAEQRAGLETAAAAPAAVQPTLPGAEPGVPRETPTPAVAAEPTATAQVPFMITRQMEADLKAQGFDEAAINAMTPAQAHATLTAAAVPPTTEAPDVTGPPREGVDRPGDARLGSLADSRPSAAENEPGRLRRRAGESDEQLAERRAASVEAAATERKQAHYADLFAHVAAKAQQLDPNVDLGALHQQFADRVAMREDALAYERESGHDPLDLVRAIAQLGGIRSESYGGLTGERRRLMEDTVAGRVRGIQVFTKDGLAFDEMVTALGEDQRFKWLETPERLIRILDDFLRNPPEDKTATFPGTAALRKELGIDTSRVWWRQPQTDIERAAIAADEGDISFDPSEFGQRLFEDLRTGLEGETVPTEDVLPTGEVQPRLPGTEAVREQDIPTPQLEAPFALTPPVAPERRGKQTTLFQGAYHGSPHIFERFSLQAIGTGEGAQAYGWGLYFASLKDVAQRYREQLAEPTVEIAGQSQPIPQWSPNLSPQPALIRRLSDARGLNPKGTEAEVADRVRKNIEFELAGKFLDNAGRNSLQSQLEILAAAEERGIKTSPGGRTYKVELPEDEDFLSWDLPASQQSPKVKAALRALGVEWQEFTPKTPEEFLDWFDTPEVDALWREDIGIRESLAEAHRFATTNNVAALNAWQNQHQGYFDEGKIDPTGEDLYAELRNKMSRPEDTGRNWIETPKRASEALAAQGVAGIRYLDGFSRSKGEGSQNYVVFDDQLVQIVEYDQPGRVLSPEELQQQGFDTSRPYYHQTAAANVEPILRHGFDLAKGRARLSDEGVPDGVFFKPDERDIGVGATGLPGDEVEQIPVYLRFGETRHFADRHALEGYLARDDQYDELVRDARLYDKEQAKEFDRLWKELGPKRSRLDDQLDVFLEDWNKGNVDRATKARARATELLKVEGVETVVIQKDEGSLGRKTETIITIGQNQVASAAPGEASILFQPESRNVEDLRRRGSLTISPNRQMAINLFAKADPSTVIHEFGHFFLEVFSDLAEQANRLDTKTAGQERLLANYRATLKALGVENRSQIGTAQHEQWASMFEAYIREGTAPSEELRSVMYRFRQWMLGVYGALRRIGAPLTPEVRKIFDRMLASDEQIAEAERRGRMVPLFLTKEQAQMTEERFDLYRSKLERAHRTGVERLDARLQQEVNREKEDTWKERRDAIRGDIEAEHEARPVYQALAAIRRGTRADGTALVEGMEAQPMRLSRTLIADRYGQERASRLPAFTFLKRGGMDPDVVAEMTGFASGDELVAAITAAPNMEQSIDAETDKRMLAEHGSLLLDGTLSEAAQEAAANEDREIVLREELRALVRLRNEVAPFEAAARREGRAAGVASQRQARMFAEGEARAMREARRSGAAMIRAAVPSARAIKEAAVARVGATKVRALTPAVFWAAASRAADNAVAAAARQNFDEAIRQKTLELLNLALYRTAEKAKLDADTRAKQMRQLATPAAQKKLGLAGQSYLEQVNGILDRYEFARVSPKTLAARAGIVNWAEALTAQGLPTDHLPAVVMNDARRQNYQELSYDELTGITDGVNMIVHIARTENTLRKAADKRDFLERRDALVTSIETNNIVTKLPLEFDAKADAHLKRGAYFASHARTATLARILDGGKDGGAFWEAFQRPLNEAADQKAIRQTKAYKEFRAIIDKHFPRRAIANLKDKGHVEGVGSLTREARIAVTLNSGTATGMDRLLSDRTRKWSQVQIDAIRESLDDNDLDFVEATWKFIDQFWPEIAAKQERIEGLAPEKVEAQPFTVRGREMPGGYYPLVYDGRLNARAKQNEEASKTKLAAAASYVRQTTRRGFVETRKAHVDLSTRLDLDVVFGHVEEVLHDLTHHEALLDVQRFLRDRGVQNAIYETRGSEVYGQLTKALETIALGRLPSGTTGEKAATFMRTGVQMSALGLNFWTALQQPLGIFNGAERVGGKWVMRGLGRWLMDAGSMDSSVAWIHEKSPFMRERHTNASQDLSDLREAIRTPGGWADTVLRTVTNDNVTKQTILDGYLWHIGIAQRVADIPTWLGAYEKAMAEGNDDARAVALADQAVIDSQGSGRLSDLSENQRGGPALRLFLTFYSYGATVFGQTYENIQTTDFKSPSEVLTLMNHLTLLYIMPALGTVALANLFGRRDDESWEEWLLAVASESVSTALNTLVFVREFAALAQLIEGGEGGVRGYEGPAGIRLPALVLRLAAQIKQGKLDEGLWHAANQTAGVLMKYPAGMVQHAVDGWIALEEGRTQNPFVLLTGPPPKKP